LRPIHYDQNNYNYTLLDGDGLFDNIDGILDVDLGVDVSSAPATLLFKASMSLELEPLGDASIVTISPIESCFDIEGDVDNTVGVGVLDLLSNATAAAEACFTLEYCTW